MAVLHTVAVAADTVVVAELELHTVAVVQESVLDQSVLDEFVLDESVLDEFVLDFGLIGPMRSRELGLIGRLPIGQMRSRVEFPVVSVRNRHT